LFFHPKDTPPPHDADDVGEIFDDWLVAMQDKNALGHFALQLQQQVLMRADVVHKFVAATARLVVERAHAATAEPSRTNVLGDALAKLFVLVVRLTPDAPPPHDGAASPRVAILGALIATLGGCMLDDAALRRAQFNQRFYHRVFSLLLYDLSAQDLEQIHTPLLTSVAAALHSLRPAVAPMFAYVWLELVAHRNFMPKLLALRTATVRGSSLLELLLIDMFKFLEPFLRSLNLNEPVRLFYKGALRVLLVLLHDFPEFLCDHHFALCDAIPPPCIQMRNLILSAFPRAMRPPDPFLRNLKVDLLPEIARPPNVASDFVSALVAAGLKPDVDAYVKSRKPALLDGITPRLILSRSASGAPVYNAAAINSLVREGGGARAESFKSIFCFCLCSKSRL
jgi:CCR4-NOT transcription complex subunit 1